MAEQTPAPESGTPDPINPGASGTPPANGANNQSQQNDTIFRNGYSEHRGRIAQILTEGKVPFAKNKQGKDSVSETVRTLIQRANTPSEKQNEENEKFRLRMEDAEKRVTVAEAKALKQIVQSSLDSALLGKSLAGATDEERAKTARIARSLFADEYDVKEVEGSIRVYRKSDGKVVRQDGDRSESTIAQVMQRILDDNPVLIAASNRAGEGSGPQKGLGNEKKELITERIEKETDPVKRKELMRKLRRGQPID